MIGIKIINFVSYASNVKIAAGIITELVKFVG